MKKILLVMISCWLLVATTQAQQRTVTGKVTDAADGSAVPGVSVVIRGTSVGTVTDADGNFSIGAAETDVLAFSFIGFETLEIPVGQQTVVNAALVASIEQLGEVVVIGYGEKSRAMLTESIGTVDAKQIQQLPVASPEAALQGRISGVQITSVDGTPGSPVAIRIRGVGTTGNTAPLYVIDGIPVKTSLVNGDFDTSPNSSILATLNPSDIESISVLKDASAAAVYGVRAGNGVVLITTKRGKTGKPRVSFDSYYGVQNFPKVPKWNNTAQYLALTQEANANYNQYNGLNPGDPGFLTLHPDLAPGSPYLNVNTDWQDAAMVKNAPITNSNISVSGGNENANYFVSAGYFKQEAMVPNWDMSRYTFRANSDYKVGTRFKFGQTLTISYQDTQRGSNNQGDGFIFSSVANMPPFMSIYDDPNNPIPGNRYGFHGNQDVAGLTVQNAYGVNSIVDNHDRDLRLLGGIYAELEIIKNLKFRSSASLDFSHSNNSSWNPGYTAEELGIGRPQLYNNTWGEFYTKVFTQTLNYANTFGKHNVNAIVGFEYQEIRGAELGGSGTNFISTDPDFYSSVKNAGTLNPVYSARGNDAYQGIIARVSYDYEAKYLLTLSMRRDAAANFAPEYRWVTFPAVSAAWRISQEDFFSGISLINDLKLRASWGQLGNSAIGTPFPYISRFSATPDYGVGNTGAQAIVPVAYTNRTVSWETVETIDFGFDMTLLDNRVNFLATYYDRTTKDFLYGLPIPAITGFGNIPINAGDISNKGIELELGYNGNIGSDVTFNVSGNFTTVRNRLERLSPGIEEYSSGDYRTAVGYPIGYFYGYNMLGIYQNATEAGAALPDDVAGSNRPGAGDVIFEDNNSPAADDAPAGQQFSGEPDGIITPADRTYLGKTIPGFYYGLSINAAYKGFDLAILFQGVGDVQVYNQFRRSNESLTGGGRNNLATVQGRWTGENTSNSMPRAISNDPYQNNRFSSRWIEDAGFLRLRNIQIGYSLPSEILQKTGFLTRARIYIAGSNLFRITDYSGLDPEVMTYGTSSTHVQANTDAANVPQPRLLQAGVQLEF